MNFYFLLDGSLNIPSVSTQQQTILNRRRCSAKDNELTQSHHELFDNKKRRTSVPTTNTISYISSENISTKIEDEEETTLFLNKPCAHKKTAIVGYRCEKHGGRGYNSSKESSVAIFRRPNNSYNSISSTSVNASYSDTGTHTHNITILIIYFKI